MPTPTVEAARLAIPEFTRQSPDRSPDAVAPDPALRVIAITGSAVASIADGLAVADQLEGHLGRVIGAAIIVDVVLESFLDLDAAEEAVWATDLREYDALLIALEPDRDGCNAARLRDRLGVLLDEATARLPIGAMIAVAPPAQRDDDDASIAFHAAILAAVASPLRVAPEFDRTVPGQCATAESWARSVATAIGTELTAGAGEGRLPTPCTGR